MQRRLEATSYVTLLRQLFRMRTAHGTVLDYTPLPFQEAWHNHSYLVDPDAPDRIWIKGRGLGASAITMMDMIMTGLRFDGVAIPVASMTKAQARWGPIAWGKWLIDTAKPLKGHRITRDPAYEQEILFPDTGSRIFPIPGNNPNSLRTYRSIAIFFDEFDWCEQPEALLAAGESCLSEGGQASIISTIQSRHGEFARLIADAQALGYWVHHTPTWPTTVDVTKSLTEQMVQPIAPWIDVQSQERQRRRDLPVFLREHMCEAPDVDDQFLTWPLIAQACHLRFEQQQHERWRKQQRDAEHLIQVGWDFARIRDFSVCEVVECIGDNWYQIYERLMRGVETGQQLTILAQIVDAFRPELIRIDRTGSGIGFYDLARDRFGHAVRGLDFASKLPTGHWAGRKRIMEPARQLYALNLRTILQDAQLHLFDYAALKHDLHSISYDLKHIQRTADQSHGDRFWALALATYPAPELKPIQIAFGMRPEVRALRERRRYRTW
jgi:phage FluMu gp28-like protein